MGGWGAVPAWARFPSPFGPWVMGVWVRLFGAAEGEGAVRGRAAARSSPAGWVRSRPWRPSPTPLSAVDLGQFAVWHNADLDPEHVLSTLALLPATRAEVEGLESALLFTARSAGRTWAQIANAMGFNSPQACQQHYTRLTARQDAGSGAS
ncbi:DNA-binding protein [Streptosporangium sp. NBC_01469]|uniref:DNA-binding protein n=1 Tax=Streptosporangium sp. NBC_01469 TaxID=2903898 RepID=UPI002E280C60|nr:DNA-binding protein [Streptosporangium sp. NBC_01469]